MFRRLNDVNKIFGTVDFFNNHMNRLLDDFEDRQRGFPQGATWPPTNFYDNNEQIFVYCAVPGIKEDEISINLHNNLLTIKGKRTEKAPDGYTILRQERHVLPFSRTFSLPVEIDPEKTTAELRNGVLTVKLMKAQAAKPIKILVKAA